MTNHSNNRDTLNPRIRGMLDSAVRLHRQGRLGQARRVYLKVLKKAPRCATAHHMVGLIDFHAGQAEPGIKRLQKAVALAPDEVALRHNLGNMLHELGRVPEAEEEFRAALRLDSEHAEARNGLGICLKDSGKLDEAIDEYRKAIAHRPAGAGYHRNLGQTLKLKHAWGEAEEAFRKVIELLPDDADAHRNLGVVLRHQGRFAEAKESFMRLVELEPDNPVASHFVAACDPEHSPDRAGSDYVRQVFDEFAETFETHLGQLGYDAPQWIGRVVQELVPDSGPTLAILDMGCGTGLCGSFLKPGAKHLVGVDLSPGMLKQAEAKGVYDDLVESDLIDYLRGHPGQFDVLVAADTLNYLGDLDPVFEAASGALTNSGALVFTVEKDPDQTSEPYRLFPHGRFGHNESYVNETLERHGFSVVTSEERVLRTEADAPVFGLFLVARKAD